MLLMSILFHVFTSTSASLSTGTAPNSNEFSKRAALDDWIANQSNISLSGVLANTGSTGAKSYGAANGLVLASPSTANPNYYYTWTRDAALTFKALVDYFNATKDSNIQIEINNYISAQASLQTISNPSGIFLNGSNLGEPKYLPNGTAFTGDWGRPQRDGPALRATALIAYGKWLQFNNYSATAAEIVWPIVKNDLEYVAQYWNHTGFDLWEEVNASSFFTTAAQHRALVEGSAFAASVGSSCPNCAAQSPYIRCFLQQYWNGEYIASNINTGSRRSGKDASSILASLHAFDPEAACDDTTFQPCSPKMLANHKVVTDSFRAKYEINRGIEEGSAVAVGRYPEDVYYNGNPWYLTTLAAAEQLYLALNQYTKAGSITITSTSLGFWQAIYVPAVTGTYPSSSSLFVSLTTALKKYADGYVAIAQKYTPQSGALAEQFDKSTGLPTSAADLTWSYASFLTMNAARNNIVPASWGAQTAKEGPSICSSPSLTNGTYTPATNTNWPNFPCVAAPSVLTTFNILAPTTPGQAVYIIGSLPEIGNWDASKALQLNASRYQDDLPLWYGSLTLGAGTKLEYKYLRKEADGSFSWEKDPNQQYTVPKSCRDSAAVVDTWR